MMFVAAISAFATCGMVSGQQAKNPNIIYILADDLGYGDVKCFNKDGKISTPNLDRMAKEGMRFTNHFAGGGVCGPSRACLMTGQSQVIGYIKGNPGGNPERENLRAEDMTVAMLLQNEGYEKACIGKWGLGKQGMSGYPLNKGFDRFVGYDTHVSSHDFLYLAYTIPHSPYNPPDLGEYAHTDWPETYRKYAAMISRMDRDVGRLLQILKEPGQSENTLVIFASDNGPQSEYSNPPNTMTAFFDSNGEYRGIKRDVYHGGIIVPFIAWWPGKVKEGTESNHLSGFQDFLPTVCELTGIELKTKTDGISYLPSLLGKDKKQAKHIWMYWEFISMGGSTTGGRQSVLNVEKNVKAVHYGRFRPIELYDLNNDPAELVNVASEYSKLAEQCTRYLDNCRTASKLWPNSMLDKGWNPSSSKNE
jgi:arylsulfatase A-like enzyme